MTRIAAPLRSRFVNGKTSTNERFAIGHLEPSNLSDPALKKNLSPTIFLVQLPPKAHAVAKEAAQLAFPDGKVQTVANLAAIKCRTGAHCLIVLGQPDTAATTIAKDGRSPHHAVVILGDRTSGGIEAVPPKDWTVALLARAFRSALREQELIHENSRLRGDLKTIVRRVSHDLRTPLGCIFTTTDVLKEQLADQSGSAVEMVSIVKDSAVEISLVVDRVAFVLKATADPLPATVVDMAGIVSGVMRHLNPELEKIGAQIVLPPTWPDAEGVTSWLHVVWSNLLRNALQKSAPDGRIEITWQTDDDGFRFSVMDQGNGVTDHELAGLFSPFEDLHELYVRGLGLTIVQRLIALQDGRCGYEKSPDGRACFYFTLPAAQQS